MGKWVIGVGVLLRVVGLIWCIRVLGSGEISGDYVGGEVLVGLRGMCGCVIGVVGRIVDERGNRF